MSLSELSDYRATIISSQLPRKMGPLTLIQAKSDASSVTLIFTKEGSVDMDKLIERVAVSFCDNIETRYLLNSGVSYRIITLAPKKKDENLNLISIDTCLLK